MRGGWVMCVSICVLHFDFVRILAYGLQPKVATKNMFLCCSLLMLRAMKWIFCCCCLWARDRKIDNTRLRSIKIVQRFAFFLLSVYTHAHTYVLSLSQCVYIFRLTLKIYVRYKHNTHCIYIYFLDCRSITHFVESKRMKRMKKTFREGRKRET